VTKYVKDPCVKDKEKEGCDVILNPPKKTEAKKRTGEVRGQKQPKPIVHYNCCICCISATPVFSGMCVSERPIYKCFA